LLLFLDYDGTLVEIASRPALARPAPELIELLSRLTARADLKVMVVSGRPLWELQEMLPVPGMGFLGSHGGEGFLSQCLRPQQVIAAEKNELLHWRSRLEARLQSFLGWWIEDKPLGFALHYRQLSKEYLHEFIVIIEKWQQQVRLEKRFQLLAGKKVLEIMPQGVSKGAAIQEILSLPAFSGYFPIYLGDDITDESAFHLLQGRGLTIKVGRSGSKTAASHFLLNPEEVRRFLTALAFLLEDHDGEYFRSSG